jgi:hypothetical protein
MSGTRTAGQARLRDALRRVHDGIAAAAERSGRRREDVVLVAVTKHASPDQLRVLVEMGQVDLGENRVQQLTQRAAQLQEYLERRKSMGEAVSKPAGDLPARVRWHMVGHLQRNKVKQVVPVVRLIHSVDSFRLAEELHAYGARQDQVVDVLIQVNASGEESKFGISLPAVSHLVEQVETMVHLKLRGLMTIAPHEDDPEKTRPVFARVREQFEDIRASGVANPDFNILSMGMTNDYRVAIEEGANVVRIGTALFGSGGGGDGDSEEED